MLRAAIAISVRDVDIHHHPTVTALGHTHPLCLPLGCEEKTFGYFSGCYASVLWFRDRYEREYRFDPQ